jgi:hypothetical protein
MSEQLNAFKRDVQRQLGDLTPEQWRANHPGQHLYATYGRYDSCAWCGRIKPRGKQPSTCPGVVKIALR